MSEDHFHVHGPHDHEVEHRAEHDPFAGRIAVMTAIFATIGALFGYMAGTIKICGDIVSPLDDLEWTGDAENI